MTLHFDREHYRKKYEVDPRYTAGADDFDNEYSLRNDAQGLYFETERMRLLFSLLNRQRIGLAGKRILDAGCNYGFYTSLFAYLRRDPTDVYGVDFIKSNIDTAKVIHPSIAYDQQDLYEGLRFEDESFDFVLVNYVMSCITERRAEVFAELEAKVKPGGHILFFGFFGDFEVNWVDLVEGALRLQMPLAYAQRKKLRNMRMDTYPACSKAEMSAMMKRCEIIDYGTMRLPKPTLKYKWKEFLATICKGYKIDRYCAILMQKK